MAKFYVYRDGSVGEEPGVLKQEQQPYVGEQEAREAALLQIEREMVFLRSLARMHKSWLRRKREVTP